MIAAFIAMLWLSGVLIIVLAAIGVVLSWIIILWRIFLPKSFKYLFYGI